MSGGTWAGRGERAALAMVAPAPVGGHSVGRHGPGGHGTGLICHGLQTLLGKRCQPRVEPSTSPCRGSARVWRRC